MRLYLIIQAASVVFVVAAWGPAQYNSNHLHSCCVHVEGKKKEKKERLKLNNHLAFFGQQ